MQNQANRVYGLQLRDAYMKHQIEHSWNALITNYVKHGELHRALSLYWQMRDNGALDPTRSTIVALLKACTALKDLEKGSSLHAAILRDRLFEKDVFIASTLIHMYAKCGSLTNAQVVFDMMSTRDVVMWTALIGGYADHGDGERALNLARQMQRDGIFPDALTLLCCLKACGSAESPDKGQELHLQAALRGLEGESAIGNTLVDMYAKCGMLATAYEVFNRLPVQNVVSWTALISGYAEHGHGEEALDYFKQMQHHHGCSNAITFACILKACGTIGAIDEGQGVHSEIVRKGLEGELLVRNTLVHVYSKWGLLVEARSVLDNLSNGDVVSCNALLSGYADHGNAEDALAFLEKMQQGRIAPNAITFVCGLKACGCIRATGKKGFRLHGQVIKQGLERDLLVGSTLADMYARGGFLAEAQAAFNTLRMRDVISWTVLITGYVECEQGGDALRCLEQMQLEGVHLNAATFISALKACGSTGAIVKGGELHTEVIKKGLDCDLLVSSSLVHMYAKCGLTREAENVFEKLPDQDEVSFNALIAAYAQVGESEFIFSLFEKMSKEGKKPDMVTFVSVLNACSHAALIDEGLMSLKVLDYEYGITASLEHFACMIDLFSRAGSVDRMVAMVMEMPFHPGIVEWLTVLGACRRWCDVKLGKQAFDHAVELDKGNIGAYTSMYNIYADVFMQEIAMQDVAMVDKDETWRDSTSSCGISL